MKNANYIDYLDWRGDLSFAQAPFCEVDNLILSVCSYADFSGQVPGLSTGNTVRFRDAAVRLTAQRRWERVDAILMHEIPTLLQKAAFSTRFGSLLVGGYEDQLDPNREMQFAAITFLLPDESLFVAFRGTDNSLVGWKEDFQMSFTSAIPSQRRAEQYLLQAAAHFPGKIRVGGHSKGGNLSIWAAIHAPPPVRQRIAALYSNDGPGFAPETLRLPAYQEMKGRILTLIPQSSLVGMLLRYDQNFQVVQSVQTALLQHDPSSWQVQGPTFRHLKKRSVFGEHSAQALQGWISSMSPHERAEFTDILFGILSSTNAKTLTAITDSLVDSTFAMFKAYRTLPPAARREMRSYLKRLMIHIGRSGKPSLQLLPKKKYFSLPKPPYSSS